MWITRHAYVLFFMVMFVAVAVVADEKRSYRLNAYVTDWALPKRIAWNKLDHVLYAFAVPDRNGQLGQFDGQQLQKVVNEAHANRKAASLSVGGWTGSVYFSSLIRTPASRNLFANNLLILVKKYNLDGLNLDWEYPNADNGVSCNQKHPHDTENLLAFVQLLRSKLNKLYPRKHKAITVAVASQVFNDGNKKPSKRLSQGWAKAVDAFYVMAYDLRGTWDTTTGPNAPLRSGKPGMTTAASAMQAWAAAGIPHHQLVLGVPFYGYVTRTDPTARATTSMEIRLAADKVQIAGDEHDSQEKEPCPGASRGVYSGEYQWRSIKRDGILANGRGWHSVWDRTTRTPYSVNRVQHKFLTFDDPKSLHAKAEFVEDNEFGGIMLWSLEMDDNENSLLNALQSVRED